MFGGGLPHAWPYAAVALHHLDGFAERFAEAAAVSEKLFGASRGPPRVTVVRPANATNVTLLQVAGETAAGLPPRPLPDRIWIRPARRMTLGGAGLALHTQQSLLPPPRRGM